MARRYARIIDGVVRVIQDEAGYDATLEGAKEFWEPLDDDSVVSGAVQASDGSFTNPPPTPEPPAEPETAPPTSYYVPKVTFERRIPNVPWLKIQALRKTISAYDETWLTDVAKAPMLPLVRGFGLYDATDQLNVLDAAVTELLWGFQQAAGVFGTDEEAAAAIGTITTPHPLPGEPGA